MDNYHITYNKNSEQWQFKKSGNERPTFTADTKADAIGKMQSYMQNHPGSVKIHKVNNIIQEERTYPRSIDPRKTEG